MAEYGTANYIRTDSWRPGWVRYMYVDVEEYLADAIFETYDVHPKYANGEYFYPGTPYVLAECRVRAAQAVQFEECMGMLERKALLKGYADYPAMCKEILGFGAEEEAMEAYERSSGQTDHLRAIAEGDIEDPTLTHAQEARIKEAYRTYDEYEFDIWAKGFYAGGYATQRAKGRQAGDTQANPAESGDAEDDAI